MKIDTDDFAQVLRACWVTRGVLPALPTVVCDACGELSCALPWEISLAIGESEPFLCTACVRAAVERERERIDERARERERRAAEREHGS